MWRFSGVVSGGGAGIDPPAFVRDVIVRYPIGWRTMVFHFFGSARRISLK